MVEIITKINDALNGFIWGVPNLIAIFLLTPVVLRLIKEHFNRDGGSELRKHNKA